MTPYALGQQWALAKLGAYSPEQLRLMQEHWGISDPKQMLELNRGRALANPGPEATQFNAMHDASRARAGLGPNVSQAPPSVGWKPGTPEPVDVVQAHREAFMRDLSRGAARGRPPAPVESLAPFRRGIPAAAPTTPPFTRLPGGTATIHDLTHSLVVPGESTVKSLSKVLRAVR